MALSRFLLFCLAAALVGCGTSGKPAVSHAEAQREKLLEVYPLGKTTRGNIAAGLRRPPESAFGRPPGGWEAEPDLLARSYAARAEKRIGREIAKLERYYGTDGSGSKCYYWFYYDAGDVLVDTDWQWTSDGTLN